MGDLLRGRPFVRLKCCAPLDFVPVISSKEETMPTYEYRCPKGHLFETIQKMSDPPVASCPECDADAERLISAGAGFLFKGPGFYITDYRSDAYREQARKEEAFSGSKASKEGGDSKAESSGSEKAPSAEGGSTKSKAKESSSDGNSSTGAGSSGGASSAPPSD